MHQKIGISLSIAALGTGGSRGISAQLDLAFEQRVHALRIHYEENEISRLVMNPKGVDSLLKSKIKLGGDASAAAGPKGRDAQADTDLLMHSEILSYSRSRGLFAGVSLEGSTLRQDNSANEKVYGHKISARQIVRQHAAGTPAAGQLLVSTLQKASPRNLSDPKSLQNVPAEKTEKKK